MTEISNKSFSELDKFPVCSLNNCLTHLEIQNRFKCQKCSQLYCCEHRIDFKHNCPAIKTNVQNCTLIKNIQLNKCSEVNCSCKLTEINKFNCKQCNKLFCASHRLEFEHKCINNHQKKL
jgi:hypothetical protein